MVIVGPRTYRPASVIFSGPDCASNAFSGHSQYPAVQPFKPQKATEMRRSRTNEAIPNESTDAAGHSKRLRRKACQMERAQTKIPEFIRKTTVSHSKIGSYYEPMARLRCPHLRRSPLRPVGSAGVRSAVNRLRRLHRHDRLISGR